LGKVPEGGGEDVAKKEKETDEESVKYFKRSGWGWHRARRGSAAGVLWLVFLNLEGASRQAICGEDGRFGIDVGIDVARRGSCVEGESWAV
jgi:hypothetical protein